MGVPRGQGTTWRLGRLLQGFWDLLRSRSHCGELLLRVDPTLLNILVLRWDAAAPGLVLLAPLLPL